MVYKGSLEEFKLELKNNLKNPGFISNIENLTEEMAIEAVRVWSYYFRYLPLQTPTICLEAVRKDGLLLEYVWKQTDVIVREAVRKNKRALRFVKDEFKNVALDALKGREPFIVKAETQENVMGNKYDVTGLLFYGTKGNGDINYWGVLPINYDRIILKNTLPIAINFETIKILGRYDRFFKDGLEDNGLMYFPTTEEQIQHLNNKKNEKFRGRR